MGIKNIINCSVKNVDSGLHCLHQTSERSYGFVFQKMSYCHNKRLLHSAAILSEVVLFTLKISTDTLFEGAKLIVSLFFSSSQPERAAIPARALSPDSIENEHVEEDADSQCDKQGVENRREPPNLAYLLALSKLGKHDAVKNALGEITSP